MQTSLENTKTELAYLHKSKKHLTVEKEGLEKELAAVQKSVQMKDDRITDIERQIKDLKDQIGKKDAEMNEYHRLK